jgi:hypothetical protein
MTLCSNCQAKLPTLAARLSRANAELWQLGHTYYLTVPFDTIDGILSRNGFRTTRDTEETVSHTNGLHAYVGESKWLHINWHKMESGRWEVVAYVN